MGARKRMSIQDILQTIINSLPMIGRYALVTMGIVLIFRTTATTNFAQGLIATFGTFVVTWAACCLQSSTSGSACCWAWRRPSCWACLWTWR